VGDNIYFYCIMYYNIKSDTSYKIFKSVSEFRGENEKYISYGAICQRQQQVLFCLITMARLDFVFSDKRPIVLRHSQ